MYIYIYLKHTYIWNEWSAHANVYVFCFSAPQPIIKQHEYRSMSPFLSFTYSVCIWFYFEFFFKINKIVSTLQHRWNEFISHINQQCKKLKFFLLKPFLFSGTILRFVKKSLYYSSEIIYIAHKLLWLKIRLSMRLKYKQFIWILVSKSLIYYCNLVMKDTMFYERSQLFHINSIIR